jgi:hypothetical protein
MMKLMEMTSGRNAPYALPATRLAAGDFWTGAGGPMVGFYDAKLVCS